jgi:hypothetical protein
MFSSVFSMLLNMILLFACYTPFYVSIAGLSFAYYTKNLQAADTDIERFKRSIYFPTKILFSPQKSPVMYWLLGKETDKSSLNRLNLQRIFLSLVCVLFHIPLFMWLFVQNKPVETSFYTVFIVVSLGVIMVCVRFGHSLSNK